MVVLTFLRKIRPFYGANRFSRPVFGRVLGWSLLVLAWGLLPIGCMGPRTTQPEVDPAGLTDEAFQSYLAEAPYVTVDEGYRAMLILADGHDGGKTFEERRQKLEDRGIARAAWQLKPDHVLDAGSISYMVMKICQVRGGVNCNLMGSWGLGDRRYAMRELVYRGMLDDSVDYQAMTGGKLIALMAKADELMEKKGLYESTKIDLSDETDRDPSGNLIVPPIPAQGANTPAADGPTGSGAVPAQPAANESSAPAEQPVTPEPMQPLESR